MFVGAGGARLRGGRDEYEYEYEWGWGDERSEAAVFHTERGCV